MHGLSAQLVRVRGVLRCLLFLAGHAHAETYMLTTKNTQTAHETQTCTRMFVYAHSHTLTDMHTPVHAYMRGIMARPSPYVAKLHGLAINYKAQATPINTYSSMYGFTPDVPVLSCPIHTRQKSQS